MANLTRQDDGVLLVGNARITIHLYRGPTSYVSGGEAITAADLGLKVLQVLLPTLAVGIIIGVASYRLIEWNQSTNKLVWFNTAAGVETSPGTDFSACTCLLVAIGK